MHATILTMLSTNSLAAFSAATTTAPAHKPNQARLVRDQGASPREGAIAARGIIPPQAPAVAPPRGSLLNLSV